MSMIIINPAHHSIRSYATQGIGYSILCMSQAEVPNLADNFPETIGTCGTMAKRVMMSALRAFPIGTACMQCDLYAVEDINHVVMQCPGTQQLRDNMFTELDLTFDAGNVIIDNGQDGVIICLGKCPQDYNEETIETVSDLIDKNPP